MPTQDLANDLNELSRRLGFWRAVYHWNGKGYELNERALHDVARAALDKLPHEPVTVSPDQLTIPGLG